jgi:murein L,D-transpeptidase YcbB/YkuD
MVKVRPPMRVTIGYFTAWVDSKGRLNFRNDVYGHDARLGRELFASGPFLARDPG